MITHPMKVVDWQPPKGCGWFQISGSLTEKMVGDSLSKVLNWTAEQTEPNTFVFYLDSVGGNVGDALAIRGTIGLCRRRGHKVVIVILGRASSCAVVLATAGDEVYMDENAWIMIHAVESAADGGAAKLCAEGEYIKRLNRQTFALMATPYWSPAEIATEVKENHTIWLSPKEAWERGFLNGVLSEPTIAVRVLADQATA